jgi:hypothetical protein
MSTGGGESPSASVTFVDMTCAEPRTTRSAFNCQDEVHRSLAINRPDPSDV